MIAMKREDIVRQQSVLKIHSEIRRILANRLRSKDFIEIAPVILSPLTDPLNQPTIPKDVVCYGKRYHLTQSMIFHKQMAMRSLEKIFTFSPNIRIEPLGRKKTGMHLFEFTQLDLEIRNASREYVMDLCEEMLIDVIQTAKKDCKKELSFLGRELRIPKRPFKQIRYEEAYKQYGEDFESVLSKMCKEPVWIIDIPLKRREFYDREYPEKPGFLRDMDLIYPEGYGESLSGGEREYQYDRIKKRILQKGWDISQFKQYLQLAKNDFPPSAGFGIGIERLTRFICGLKRIEETTLFPKTPGKMCI